MKGAKKKLAKISKICEWILAAHEKIRFAMVIDGLGNVQCLKTIGLYELPSEISSRLGDSLAVMAGSLFKDLSLYHGAFEYAIVKHARFSTVGLRLKNAFLVFVAAGEATAEFVNQVRDTLRIYGVETE